MQKGFEAYMINMMKDIARGIGEKWQLLQLHARIFLIFFPLSWLWQEKVIIIQNKPHIIPQKSQTTPIEYPYIPVKATDYKYQRQVKKNTMDVRIN